MAARRIVDVLEGESFGLIPPCADPAFDHRTCDYWEDPAHGSRAHRPALLSSRRPATPGAAPGPPPDNPFAAPTRTEPARNPFDPRAVGEPQAQGNPFARAGDPLADNPLAAGRPASDGSPTTFDGPRKLGLLTRGRTVFGSYARVLLLEDRPVAYCQFGPLSAYPRALHVRELYPRLPVSPLPAVITCIATTREARGAGHALALVDDVCNELSRRGFTAVEAYPESTRDPDATSAATPRFWIRAGFTVAAEDERFPVLRRELD